MTLLVATDQRFYASDDREGYFDYFSMDRPFFDDYRTVFEDVLVAGRVRRDAMPAGVRRADGDGVRFFPVLDSVGPPWIRDAYTRHPRLLKQAVAQADAVCARVPSMIGEISAWHARRAGKPVMFEAIGDHAQAVSRRQDGFPAYAFTRWNAAQMRRLIAAADCGTYVSRAHLQKAYPPRADAPHDSVSSIRLDASLLRPARVFTSPPRPLRLVLIASFVPVKRHDVLLKGVASAIAGGAQLTLDLIGASGNEAEMERFAASLGLAPHVTFHGHIADRERLLEIIDAADLFVMTSDSEGMPRSMIEAMARGLPAIGTRAGGIAEILPEEALLPPGEPEALAAALIELANDAARLSRLAQHSEATARQFEKSVLSQKRVRLLRHLRGLAEKRVS